MEKQKEKSGKTPKKGETKSNIDPMIVKYVTPAAVLAIGLMLGGQVLNGVYVGILTTAGFWLLLEKCKDHYPRFYNTMMDYAVEADFVISGLAVISLGMSVTGIIAGAVVNVLGSVVLDYYRDYIGKVEGYDSLSFKGAWASVKGKFTRKPQAEDVSDDIPEATYQEVA